MKKALLLMLVGLIACSGHKIAGAQALSIPHPDDPAKKVEYFLEKPKGYGPWPMIVLLHGHQEWPRAGGKDFVKWGVLDEFAGRGYLAVAISQPGYGGSTGAADFCGPASRGRIRQGQQSRDSGGEPRRVGGRHGCCSQSFDPWDCFDLRSV